MRLLNFSAYQMRPHPVIWLGVVILCGLVLWLANNNDETGKSPAKWLTGVNPDTETNLSDRDNAAEEVRAVATRIGNIEQAIEHQVQLNQEERDRLEAFIKSNSQSIIRATQDAGNQEVVEQIAISLNALESRMIAIENQPPSDRNTSKGPTIGNSALYWIASSDAELEFTPYVTLPAGLVTGKDNRLRDDLLPSQSSPSRAAVPHLTIPATTTLLNGTALTALIGRIPVQGQLQDPWRFKVIVGTRNLAANGHRIARLAGMLLAGTARGDLSLSCVSGNIDTATFIFADGTIQTARSATDPESSFAGLGWISDEFGNPCIAGELKSNALQYLTQATLVNTAKSTAEAIANAQTETSTAVNSAQRTTSVVGDIDQYIAGYATQESLSTVAQWLNDRQLNSFDAIYVPAGHSVAIHIEKAIHIDQDPAARKVTNFPPLPKYANARQGWTD